nr:hypothetical protein GZ11A10_7 [uncultured archaeon GZfos11A10]
MSAALRPNPAKLASDTLGMLGEITKRNVNMKDAIDCINMTEIRTAIDSIDNQIVELIDSRSKYVKEAAKFKKDEKAVTDSNRVQEVINSKKELAEKYGASPELIEKIYKIMIDFFINEEMKEWESK